MNTAKKMKNNYHTKAAYELVSSIPCPRSASDVYSLGVSLQYCIRAKYIELEDLKQDVNKTFLADQAAQQLVIKSEIEKLTKNYLNTILVSFYDQGGPIIEPQVSDQMAREIQPFYNKIMTDFLKSLDDVSDQAAAGKISVEELVSRIDKNITEMYNALIKMFRVKEIEDAFTELIEIRR